MGSLVSRGGTDSKTTWASFAKSSTYHIPWVALLTDLLWVGTRWRWMGAMYGGWNICPLRAATFDSGVLSTLRSEYPSILSLSGQNCLSVRVRLWCWQDELGEEWKQLEWGMRQRQRDERLGYLSRTHLQDVLPTVRPHFAIMPTHYKNS